MRSAAPAHLPQEGPALKVIFSRITRMVVAVAAQGVVPHTRDGHRARVSLVTEQRRIVADAALLLYKNFDHLRCNARRQWAVLAAFKVHNYHDLRVAPWSDPGKPAVAFQVAFQRAFLDAVDLKVVMAYSLRTARFPCEIHTLNMRGHAGSSRMENVRHGISDCEPVLRVDSHTHHVRLAAFRLGQVLVLRRQLLRIDHVWPVKGSAHGNATNGARNLYGTYRDGALPNAYHACPFGDLLNAQPLRQRIEKDIARLINSLGNIRRPMCALRIVLDPALVVAAKENPSARAVHHQGLGHAFLQTRYRHNDLEHRTGRHLRLNGFVQQWRIRIFRQLFPFFGGDAHGKIVRIESWPAHHGQYFPIARVHGDDCTVLAFQCLLCRLLHIQIDSEIQLMARHSRYVGVSGTSNFLASAVDQHAAGPVLAHQKIVVFQLNAGLADDE